MFVLPDQVHHKVNPWTTLQRCISFGTTTWNKLKPLPFAIPDILGGSHIHCVLVYSSVLQRFEPKQFWWLLVNNRVLPIRPSGQKRDGTQEALDDQHSQWMSQFSFNCSFVPHLARNRHSQNWFTFQSRLDMDLPSCKKTWNMNSLLLVFFTANSMHKNSTAKLRMNRDWCTERFISFLRHVGRIARVGGARDWDSERLSVCRVASV